MGKRLKCWKKEGTDFWRNTKNRKKTVEISPVSESQVVMTEKGFNSEGVISIQGSKKKAHENAMKYMRKNDKC